MIFGMDKEGKKAVYIAIWIFLAVLCIGYGILVRTIGSGTAFFVVWLGLGIFFLLFAIAVKKNWWNRIPRVWQRLFIGVVCVGLCVFVAIEGCIISGFAQKGEKDLDVLVVLGAQVYESGPSAVLKFRLDEAITYLNENQDTVCIVSGGQGYNEPFAEAVGMAQYLEENGIPDTRIILETESKTTAQNLMNSMKLIEAGASVGIVTNDFHVFRAVQTAKKLGMEHVCGIAAGSTRLYLPNNMLREFFGEVKYLLAYH